MAFNGVDGRTGRYLPAPESESEFARHVRDEPLTLAQLRQYRWWIERYGIDDPNRAPAQDVDPLRLDSAGWGVIFAPGITPEVEEALQPLLKRRELAAGARFKKYHLKPEEAADADRFLASCHAGPGPADGKTVPYYLLIVGSPKDISFRFQYELDVRYAVGRIHFADKSAYRVYAQNVKEAEEAAEAGGDGLPPKQLALWGVARQGDTATERSAAGLIEPLAKTLAEDRPAWPQRLFVGEQAKKEQLMRLLGGGETPSVLLTASHGLRFPCGDELQGSSQGALLCQDWLGEDDAMLPQHYFSGLDLTREANLRGLISFHFACYSGGTPAASSFVDHDLSTPQPVAPAPFVSYLAQRLLGHPRGALAVVGHIDRAWSTTFSWSDLGQIGLFENTLKRLLDGHPIGSAMEFFNYRYAELAVQYSELVQDRDNLLEVDDAKLSRTYRANNDARNFVVLGDPAVKAVFRAAT
jgi:hypothetical protein